MTTKAKVSQTQKFIKFISLQIELLKEEQTNVKVTVDDVCNQVQREVDAWVNGGEVNQATYSKMNNRIQQVIAVFMAKAVEISDLENIENGGDPNADSLPYGNASTTTNIMEINEKTKPTRQDTGHNSGTDLSHSTNTRFSILEDALLSLKKTTENIQEKQEHVNKRVDSLKNSNEKSIKEIQERLQMLEDASQEISSNVDHLFETAMNVDSRLTSLEEENKSVSVSMDELNNKICSVRTCSNDAIMSVQDIRKDLEDINKNHGDMSDEMNRLQISLNSVSSHFTEQFENMSSIGKDKVDKMIGLVCQLFSKRLFPLQKLNETLNKNFICSKEYISKQVEAMDTKFTEISCKVVQIERQFNKPAVGFQACKTYDFRLGSNNNIATFDTVLNNHGSHFNQISGKFTAPFDGIYLISINLSGIWTTNGSHKISCIHEMITSPKLFDYCVEICSVTDDNCVTSLVELKAGSIIGLGAETKAEKPFGLIRIQFSCFFYQMSWTRDAVL